MDPSYLNIVDTEGLVWTLLAYLVHAVSVLAHAGLACFLLATGALEVARPKRVSRLWRRLGAAPQSRAAGAGRWLLGLLLFAPFVLGAPAAVSLGAAVAAAALLWWVGGRLAESDRTLGRWARGAAIGFATAAALFMVWEREDSLALAADVVLPAIEWRNEELGWQLETDPRAPKIGELAPDFELQDPDGVMRVRLSDYRGKRPVALAFGSYT